MSIWKQSADEEVSRLAQTALFKDVETDHIKKILAACRRVGFQRGDIIMKEGDEGDSIYIILEGTVEVAKNLILGDEESADNPSNKVFTKLSAENHAVFGEIALLDDSKRTATVKAVTDCEFLEIKNRDLLALVGKDHDLGYRIVYNLAKIVSSRLRKADEEVVKLTTVLSIILKES